MLPRYTLLRLGFSLIGDAFPTIYPPKSFLFLPDLLLDLEMSVGSELGVFGTGLPGLVLFVESLQGGISLSGLLLCS